MLSARTFEHVCWDEENKRTASGRFRTRSEGTRNTNKMFTGKMVVKLTERSRGVHCGIMAVRSLRLRLFGCEL
jgi:hypothetical protein